MFLRVVLPVLFNCNHYYGTDDMFGTEIEN